MANFLTSLKAAFSGINPIPQRIRVGYRGFFDGCFNWNSESSILEGNPNHYRTHNFSGVGTFHSGYDGQKYTGHWQDNILGPKTGRAVMLLKNTDLYLGELVNGIPQGQGKLIFGQSLTRHEGLGRQDNSRRYNSDARFYDTYEGGFVNGVPSGMGTLKWLNGTSYSGNFTSGKKNGIFKAEFPNGRKLLLNFQQDELKGISLDQDKPSWHTPKAINNNEVLVKSGWKSAILLSADGLPSFFYDGEISKNKPSGIGFRIIARIAQEQHTTKGTFVDENAHGACEEISWIGQEDRDTDRNPESVKLAKITKIGTFEKGRFKGQAQTEIVSASEIKPKLFEASEAPKVKKSIAPLSPEDNRGLTDIHGDPESRASRVLGRNGTSSTKYIVADGSLYVKKSLRGTQRYDLEVADIIEDRNDGTVTVETSIRTVNCDGLGGTVAELAMDLRLERARVYPQSRRAKQDRVQYPNLPWYRIDNDEGPGGVG